MSKTSTWLEVRRSQTVDTDEWRGVSCSIYQHLQETLANDRAGFFSELTAAEQLAYMNRIEQRLPTLPAPVVHGQAKRDRRRVTEIGTPTSRRSSMPWRTRT
ncbi:Rab-GAP TBC domain-containing protein [Plasmodiophora brassicae]